MSRFSNWKAYQVSRSLMSYDDIRAPRERRKEKKEALSEEQPRPLGQRLPKKEGAQVTGNKARDAGDDKAAEDGASLGKRESRKDARGTDWKLPVPLGPVYPPLVSSLSSVKALGRSWELTPPTANRFRIHNVHAAHLPQQGPFQNFMDLKAEKRLAGRKERRSHFGDINTHKCYQFGQIFCPFQALATTVSTDLGKELKAGGHSCVQQHSRFQKRKRSGERGIFCDTG
ncbi:uncharacterized protein LOC128064404 [Budorcas taxicolor]|uniref:uncharacterized protein LOC128064404 n=1 Tax=Budorcas taxicolor TaxID=37181 RepID=UPI00228418EC|nr:uncharacterized protein LOC128064404 [Budorcas taxicolor]